MRGTLKKILSRTKVDMKLINGSWFSLFSNFEEETGLEHFYFVGKLSVRLLLHALDDCSQLKIQLRIGKVICGFPEHGPNWRSWPTSCTNFNVAGNL